MNHPRHHSSQGAGRALNVVSRMSLFQTFRPFGSTPKAALFGRAMLRGIFTKFDPSNPVKAPSDAVNSKPAAFIPC
jgi:hypothetical protein